MLRLLSQYSRGRTAWFLLVLSALSFEITALYFQHGLGLQPCVLCIYQRLAILAILIAGLLALFSPKKFIFRICAIIIWLFGSIKGFQLAYEQVTLQFEPSIFNTCPVYTEFPSWLPLDQWLPAIFKADGLCSEKIWQFLTLEMSQWMLIIFACYCIVAIFVLIAQLFKPQHRLTWKD